MDELGVLKLISEGGSIVLLASVLLFGVLPMLKQIGGILIEIKGFTHILSQLVTEIGAIHRMLDRNNRDTDAIRNAIRIAYLARSNGNDENAIKSQYRMAAEILRKLENDLKAEGK